MARIEPFEEFSQEYEEWFEANKYAYESELQAVRTLLSGADDAAEIGVGSGRFAGPLGITRGVEPSAEMRRIARARGIEAVDGVAESLPYADGSLDLVLMVTTLCFLDDIDAAFKEVSRVLKPEGYFVIGFVDKESHIGRLYERNKVANPFYRTATFYSVQQVTEHLTKAGFGYFRIVQTIFRDLTAITEVEPVEEGYGKGSFVVIRGTRVNQSELQDPPLVIEDKRQEKSNLKKELSMKIAVATEDGKRISDHFGRSPYFAIFEIEEGKATNRTLRENTFTGHFRGRHGNNPHGEHHHGMGDPHAHQSVADGLGDCSVVISHGMGRRAWEDLRDRGIEMIVTDETDVETAVQRYLDGELEDRVERLH